MSWIGTMIGDETGIAVGGPVPPVHPVLLQGVITTVSARKTLCFRHTRTLVAALLPFVTLQSPGSAHAQIPQERSGPAVMMNREYFRHEARADATDASGARTGVVNGRIDLWYKSAMVLSDGTWQYDASRFVLHDDHRWLFSGKENRTVLSFARQGSSFWLLAKPEPGRPESWILHSAEPLKSAFPPVESLKMDKHNVKPQSYEGPVVENQPIRVVGNVDGDPDRLLFGADEHGDTELYLRFLSPDGGAAFAQSLAGVPGSTWVLPRSRWVSSGNIKLRGFRVRIITKYFHWQPEDGTDTTIPNVIHVEVENVDAESPGRLVYISGKNREIGFELADTLGVFVYSDTKEHGRLLTGSRGWRKVSP